MSEEKTAAGVRCPKCGCRHAPVQFTRHVGKRTIRNRECRHCGRRFRTVETAAE